MEGSVRSEGVLKKKSSSGCLIIKKKDGKWNSGGGAGGLRDRSKGRKRFKLVASSSGSSDDEESLEFMRRKVNEKWLQNGSTVENRACDSDNVGVDVGEGKRSRLDLFEFDEYDEFDGMKMRNEYFMNGFKAIKEGGGGNLKQFGVGLSNKNLAAHKRRKGSYFDGSGSGRSKGMEYGGAMNKGLEVEDDEAHLPISLLRLKHQENGGDKPFRLQGKNGVLKVMVNKKKRMDFPSQPKCSDDGDFKDREGSRSDDGGQDLVMRSPVFKATQPHESQELFVDKEKGFEKEKKERKLEKGKPLLHRDKKTRDSEVEETDSMLKMTTPSGQACRMKKGTKKELETSPSPENINSIKGKEGQEGKPKRGGSTEKQMLREKIRGMLMDACWSIDYRPRRNREYLDAVYISPSGTAFWSIIKAYDALKKQLEEDNVKQEAVEASPSFAPLSDDLINKLTRQTKKKIEEEMGRKRKEVGTNKSAKRPRVKEASSDRDQNGEHLSSYVKKNFTSRSGITCKVDHDSDSDSPKGKPGKVRGEKSSSAASKHMQGKLGKVIGSTLLVRRSDIGENYDSDGYVPYSGKRTVLAWLIDSGTAQLSEKVQYMNRKRTRVLLEGWITRDGIHCGCCSKILTVSKFELHAGSKLRQPFQNIFLESGSSLLQCQIDAWNSQEDSLWLDSLTVDMDGDDPDDDTCGICGDGGDLVCCDSCPSTFHQICLEIWMLPEDDWHCPNCTCKFCGLGSGNVDEENDSNSNELNICNFCEKKYHKSCSGGVNALPMGSGGLSFCAPKCHEIYDHLQKILGVKHELESGFSWSLIQRADVSDASQRGFAQRVENNSKLSVALSVMDECFLPIIDRRSGINIVHNVVYNCGSNFNRLNYRGFYTIILERGDEIISAATIRLHGARLAEMPFIGTREIYRRQGMCRRLLSVIETELRSLKVEQLIIPAISEHTKTWTTVFGFNKLEDVHRREMKLMNMLVFPGTDMLQKQLCKHENSGTKFSESTKNQPQLPALVENSEIDSSLKQSRQASGDSEGCHESKMNDKVDYLNHDSPASAIPSNDDKVTATSDGIRGVQPEIENQSGSTMEHELLDAEDNTRSCTNACKSENHCVESMGDSSVKTKDADEATGTWSSSEGSKSAKSDVNRDSQSNLSEDMPKEAASNGPSSCVKAVVEEEALQPKLQRSIEPSLNSIVDANGGTSDSTINNVHCNDRPESTVKEILPLSLAESSGTGSTNDAARTTDDTQNHALSTSPAAEPFPSDSCKTDDLSTSS